MSQPSPASTARSGVRAAIIVTVAGSAMAALIHAVAAFGHDGDRILVWMFGACAVAQLVWAAGAAVHPSRRLLAVGVLVNGGALLVWAASRTVGIPFIDSLADAEAVGAQDLGAAVFAAASVGAVACLLARPVARAVVTPVWTGVLAAFALLAAMPALTAEHTHDHEESHLETASAHGHTGESAAAHDDTAAHDDDATHDSHDAHDETTATTGAGHGHGTDPSDTTTGESHGGHDDPKTADLVNGHGHDTTDTTAGDHHSTATTVGHDHGSTSTTIGHHPAPTPTGPIISLDDPRVTAAQRAIAVSLISQARTALSAFPTVEAVEAAGYVSIGDGGVDGFEHYVNWSYLVDGRELDPTHIESIVVQKSLTGPKQIVSAMYILGLGKTMANVPALAGELTSWHLHDNLCFDGPKLVAIAVGGVCSAGVLTITPPMLHIWMIPRPCGPFAGLEGDGDACATHAH